MCVPKGVENMGYFEKLVMGDAHPMEEIQDMFMSSERGRELTSVLSENARLLTEKLSGEAKSAYQNYRDTSDTITELQLIAAFKLGFAYGSGLNGELNNLPIPFEPQ